MKIDNVHNFYHFVLEFVSHDHLTKQHSEKLSVDICDQRQAVNYSYI